MKKNTKKLMTSVKLEPRFSHSELTKITKHFDYQSLPTLELQKNFNKAVLELFEKITQEKGFKHIYDKSKANHQIVRIELQRQTFYFASDNIREYFICWIPKPEYALDYTKILEYKGYGDFNFNIQYCSKITPENLEELALAYEKNKNQNANEKGFDSAKGEV